MVMRDVTLQRMSGISYHFTRGEMFWADVMNNAIYRAKFRPTKINTVSEI